MVAECYTSLYQNWISIFENPEEKLKSTTEKISLEKRLATPEEIANIIIFLLSERSSHTTGQIIHVGGYGHPARAI
jgi:L-fucose dehydrogenase